MKDDKESDARSKGAVARVRYDVSRQGEYCASYYPEHDRLIYAEWLCTVALDPIPGSVCMDTNGSKDSS